MLPKATLRRSSPVSQPAKAKRHRHQYAHLRKTRRLLEKYFTVIRVAQPFPFQFLVWKAGDLRVVRVECACQGKKLTYDRDLLVAASVPPGARKEIWFLPRRRRGWQISAVG